MPLLPDIDQVLHWTGLRIEQVGLSGQRLTSDHDIFDAIGLRNAGSLLTFDGTRGAQPHRSAALDRHCQHQPGVSRLARRARR